MAATIPPPGGRSRRWETLADTLARPVAGARPGAGRRGSQMAFLARTADRNEA
jgi:hypothetical protein